LNRIFSDSYRSSPGLNRAATQCSPRLARGDTNREWEQGTGIRMRTGRGEDENRRFAKKKKNENRSQGLFGNLSCGACCGGSVARGGKWLGLSSRRRPCAPPVTPRFLPAKAKDWERGYGFQEKFYLSSLHGIKSS
jgi:hypothetical protein